MTSGADAPREPLRDLLIRLRAAVQAQAEALDRDDFERVAQVGAARDQLVAALDGYRSTDLRPEDRVVLEQVAALDQRIVASVRSGLDQANHDLRSIFRGQGALQQYRKRGQAVIQALSRLDVER